MAEEIIIEKKTPEVLKIVLAVFISALIFGLSGYYLGKNNKSTNDSNVPVAETAVISEESPSDSNIASASPEVLENYKTYINNKFKFSFQIPSDYTVMEEYGFEGSLGVILKFGENSGNDVSEYNFVTLTYNTAGASFEQMKRDMQTEIGSDLIKSTNKTIDSQPAVEYEIGGFAGGYKIISAKDKANLTINIYPSDDGNTKFTNKIVDTFKF